MLKLAVFKLMKYSFNKKTLVSDMAYLFCTLLYTLLPIYISHASLYMILLRHGLYIYAMYMP